MRTHSIIYVLAVATTLTSRPQEPDGRGFEGPEQAVHTLRTALDRSDVTQLQEIFGSAFSRVVNPDPIEATNEFRMVAAAIQQSNSLLPSGDNQMKLKYGSDDELFPVPLVQRRDRWYFDTVAGEEELINRRIGRNELTVLEIIRTYVQAQREYAAADRDDDEVLEYAQKFRSAAGRKDGLYWEQETDGSRSPLGPLVAEAEAAGYSKQAEKSPQPFHGYHFKILSRQGDNALGGPYEYIINGNMIGGFALVAWPSEYGQTGVMTFVVNQQGVVFQKDLGAKSGEQAMTINAYNPDSSWERSAD